ncbi:hypothetical protein ACFLR7_04415 [Acidobacteriota bacterium]
MMSPISHEFHKLIGKAFNELELPDKRFVILKDRACDENGHDLPLFYLSESEERQYKNIKLKGHKFTEVDLLILKDNEIKVIVEIEESNMKPNHLFGKYMAAAMSSFYIYRPGQSKENKCKMADKVQFIQILDSTRTKERSQKFEQWGQVEEAVQKLAETKLNNVIEYKLFCGKKSGSDLESGFKQRLQKHVLSIL